MANTRKSNSADLQEVVAGKLQPALAPGAHLLVGLSGGIDSVVLLHILRRLAPAMRFSLRALHVNHGISPNAGAWSEFCSALCESLGVPFESEAVDIAPYRAMGIEGAARQARYEAFSRHSADFIVFAQHSDDQAETVLLQLARGAGLKGLAGMPAMRSMSGSDARLLRPLLGVPRLAIEAYAGQHALQWVEDESNQDLGLRRNFVRARVLPVFADAFPSVRAAIARSAAYLGEAGALLDQLADMDIAEISDGGELRVSGLAGLGPARARNALRRWCELRGAPWPGSERLSEVLRQAQGAGSSAQVAVTFRGWMLRRFKGKLYLDPQPERTERLEREFWNGEPAVPLLHLGGVLRFKPEEGRGLSSARLRSLPVTLTVRQGGESLQPDCRRPRRTLKNLFQESGTPPWQRGRVPLVYCGEHLVCVPGLGEDCEWQASAGEAGLILSWEPFR